MEIREVVPDVFAQNNYLYLHCFDLRAEKDINPNTLPCVQIYTVLGHVSFPATARERRVALFVHSEENVGKISGHKSPVVIKVTSSCIYKVRLLNYIPSLILS
jgi:hypothetical protein